MTSELLFELYNAPSVVFGVDSLFAFSRQGKKDGLAINLGHQATTVVPIFDGQALVNRSKRYVSLICLLMYVVFILFKYTMGRLSSI